MKKHILWALCALMMMVVLPQKTKANDYLEQQGHYTVMSMGNGVYRFYIPIWVYGRWNNYYLDGTNNRSSDNDTYVWYSRTKNATRGSSDVHRIASIAAVRKGKNSDNDYKGEGEGFIYIHEGSAIIQSIFNGEQLVLNAGDDTYWNGWTKSMLLKRKNDDDHQDITYITFDWYPPQDIADGADFYWGVSANIHKYSNGSSTYQKWFAYSDRLNVRAPQTPELFTPYLYALDEDGVTGYGHAAVQFAVYQDPISYHTSLDATEVPLAEHSDKIVLPTTDSVQRMFSATFQVNMTQDNVTQRYTLQSNAVNIPAYHRIYDLQAVEVLDDQQSVTGNVQISWNIRNANADDLLNGDVFEVERALQPDFSDAQSISVTQYSKGKEHYTVPDNPLEVMAEDTTANSTSHESLANERDEFVVNDANGDPVAVYEAQITSNHIYEPGKPVYYRVRRASSAVWGWIDGFSMRDTLLKNNYLAPLKETQADYTLDPDYANNKKVHFYIGLDNKQVTLEPDAEDECTFTYQLTRINGDMPVTLRLHPEQGMNMSNYTYRLLFQRPESSQVEERWLTLDSNNTLTTTIPSGSQAQLSIRKGIYSVYILYFDSYTTLQEPFVADIDLSLSAVTSDNLHASVRVDREAIATQRAAYAEQYPLPDSIKHILYTRLQNRINRQQGLQARCNWDRRAIIYLQRTLVETGETIEIGIPADSVKRQADGSWIAHMTDIANISCTHYSYSVRLDQTGSSLKVMNPTDLTPRSINGPDLYYTEVAHIAECEASKGTDRFAVQVAWTPTPGSVDEYIIARRIKDQGTEFAELTTTTENEYRDLDVVPGTEYEYRVTAVYTCHETTTRNEATTTGWRSPYGLVTGRVHYEDGTGCANVTVTMTSAGGNDERITVTDDAGNYRFDSLLYGNHTVYSIQPTSQNAEFRFNNTSSPIASITLTPDNPVAEMIEFDNISSVRFSGRILYQKSTIPVRDAHLLLNGHLVQTAGGVLKTDVSGNFTILVPKNSPFTIQAIKEGHTFDGDGFVRMYGDSVLALTEALDGVRIWDKTKVRLAGRIVGGKYQADKPLGFGLSTNNLGKDLQLVLELEGDNTSLIVRDKDDPTVDTLNYTVQHDYVGQTEVFYQRKRIIIRPDSATGEYCADLFPVRYKVTQATARGYATLFAEGRTSEVLDLSGAAYTQDSAVHDDKVSRWNAQFSITYRSPIEVSCIQMRYGREQAFYGEEKMTRQNILNQEIEIPLATVDSNRVYYTFGAPVFPTAKYNFRITAHEDYYYNNEPNGKHEEVRISGGMVKIYNGLHDDTKTQVLTMPLNSEGQADVTLPIDYVSFRKTGEQALRVLDISVESDGKFIEKQAFAAYVTGNRTKGRDFTAKVNAGVQLMDVLRDPPGSKSYAYLEKGTTFKYNYNWTFSLKFGVNLEWKYGSSRSLFMGTYMATPPGTPGYFTGQPYNNTISNSFAIPITTGFTWKNGGSYTFTTNDRIETGSDSWFVGTKGDIYIGVSTCAVYELTDAVKPMDSLTYATMAAQLVDSVGTTGSARTVAEGYDRTGKKYYLVIGEEIGIGGEVDGSFVYSQNYIVGTLLPQLLRERDALLVTGDSATVQDIANAQQHEVYWSHVLPTDRTFALDNYTIVYPKGAAPWMKRDKVDEYNNTILSWIGLIRDNEKEKIFVMDGVNADLVDNYAISNGVKVTHSETYEATHTQAFRWDAINLSAKATINSTNIAGYIKNASSQVKDALNNLWEMNEETLQQEGKQFPKDIDTQMPGAKVSFNWTPVLDPKIDRDPNYSTTYKRTAGFVLQTDPYSYMNVSVLRRREQNNWFNNQTDNIRELVDDGNDYDGDSYLYGSYIYVLNGGASKCPWEGPEESVFYERGNKSVLMSHGTLKIENPRLDILNHEVSDISRDQPAIIRIRMSNETEQELTGGALTLLLKLEEGSNPRGARVLMDGMPLTGDGRSIKFSKGQIIEKTIEVYAGDGYDFENITLNLTSSCDVNAFSKATFSVHYLPVSCDVNIASPHDQWIMNTLSPQDSTGYYLPVVIDGYDVNYPEFDHVELQYKLSTQSDDGWVNVCSYYYSDSLYALASGTKAMMRAGRIENIRFYGERDPIEQEYDLRAVSFCRHGSGFISRASEVRRGIKDTRVPRVFGAAQPADAILGVGNDLKLRFNEPIAGNYLDEDNNFQILGMTNASGITTGTSLHFEPAKLSTAETQVERSLTDKSFTIDLMVRPTNSMMPGTFFFTSKTNSDYSVQFGCGEGRLALFLVNEDDVYMFLTEPNVLPNGVFSRVIAVYDNELKSVRFYIGTQRMPLSSTGRQSLPSDFSLHGAATLNFGGELDADMLEARLWAKALTQEEIAATNMRYLTGYERDLIAYYRMDEGRGNELTDKANGATLYCTGTTWNHRKGISVALQEDEQLTLNGNLLGRSAIQDESILLWFKTAAPNGAIFRAGRTDDAHGTLLAMESGRLILHSDSAQWLIGDDYANDSWHHLVLTVNRTMNNAAVFVDGELKQSFSATSLGSISGAMYLGGNGFIGNIDDLCFFEQALPKYRIEGFDNLAPSGDEMGLMAYLPFEEMKENDNGIMELVFSPNDQRIFRDANGTIVNKVIPLVLTANSQKPIADFADKIAYAPTRNQGQLTKMNFDWSFNGDELLINLNMEDREINKQTIYVTVRDVEDLNGNPMASPVSWVAFVDRNALKWSEKNVVMTVEDNDQSPITNYQLSIINSSGRRHQFRIESLPDWLTVSETYGALNALEEHSIRLDFDTNLPVGVYNDQIYLTDEEGLAEPLSIEYIVKSNPPYDAIDHNTYPFNMSVCGQVLITKSNEVVYDTDEQDIVYAMYKDDCVGMAHVSFDEDANKSKLYLTVYGSDAMRGKAIRFQLWQASTGKVFELSPNRDIRFEHGNVYGCGDGQPVILTTNGTERQTVNLQPGWNWTSFNLDLRQYVAKIVNIMTTNDPWTEGDIIKNPATQHFVIYSDSLDGFAGDFDYLRYIYTYMIYCQDGNTIHISGNNLPADSMYVPVRGGGRWSPMPCLLKQVTPVAEALADYYDYATPGDMLKSHDHFAYFSEDRRWEGDLTTMRPGEGYFFRRIDTTAVNIRFFNRKGLTAPKRANSQEPMANSLFSNPHAATNMTMIARLELNQPSLADQPLKVYVGNELAAITMPTPVPTTNDKRQTTNDELFYFITIQSDQLGELRFECDNRTLVPSYINGTSYIVPSYIEYVPDSHLGSLRAPVILRPAESTGVYKIIENDHVIIIRNGERYDVTGKRLE